MHLRSSKTGFTWLTHRHHSRAMDNSPLCFSSQQIEAILDDLIALFAEESFIETLKTGGQSEYEVVSKIIEKKQRPIFSKHGVDPEDGFRDLPRIKQFYPREHVVAKKVLFLALREESVINYAIISPNDPEYKMSVSPTMEQFERKNMDAFPAMMAALQEQLKKNPDAVNQMTPQQKAVIAQMIKTQQALQASGSPLGATPLPTAPQPTEHRGPDLDFTKPVTKSMNSKDRDDDPFATK